MTDWFDHQSVQTLCIFQPDLKETGNKFQSLKIWERRKIECLRMWEIRQFVPSKMKSRSVVRAEPGNAQQERDGIKIQLAARLPAAGLGARLVLHVGIFLEDQLCFSLDTMRSGRFVLSTNTERSKGWAGAGISPSPSQRVPLQEVSTQSDLGPTFDGTKAEWPLLWSPIKWPTSSRLQLRPENLNFNVKSFMDAATKYKEKVNDGKNSQERVNIKNTSTKTQQRKKTM